MFRWLKRTLLSTADQCIVDNEPDVVSDLSQAKYTLDELHAQALLEDKRRTLFTQLRRERKLWVDGYIPPQAYNNNRIQAHADKIGVRLPADEKRDLAKQPKEVRVVRSSVSTEVRRKGK